MNGCSSVLRTRHQTTVDARLSLILGFNHEIVHVPWIADFPPQHFLVKGFGALHVISGYLEMDD